jgi:hypothetical protein
VALLVFWVVVVGIETVAGAAVMETFIAGVPLWETASEWVYGLSVPAERLLAASLLAGQVMSGHARLEAVLACRPGWLLVEVPRVLGSAFALGLPSFHAVPGHRVLAPHHHQEPPPLCLRRSCYLLWPRGSSVRRSTVLALPVR